MFKTWSFKRKLQVTLGFLSFSALLMSAFSTYQLHHALVADKMDLLSRSAESIADKVDRNLFERYGDVQAFALSEPARSGDVNRITKFMGDMMSAYAPIYDVMIVLDKKGYVIAANSVDKNGKPLAPAKLIGKNYADQDWFRAAVEGKITPGNAHFTDLRLDTDTQSFAATDGKVMVFTAPIRDEKGEVVGVWSNRMSWKDVVDDIVTKESQKLKDEKLPTISAYLINQDGTYLLHHDDSKVLKAHAEKVTDFTATKLGTWVHEVNDNDQIKESAIEVFTNAKGYSSFPSQKWTYILRAPASDGAQRFGLLSAIVGVCCIILIAIFAAIITKRTSSSLEHVISNLTTGAVAVSDNASEVMSAAHSLSESSTQQASALQETAASIEEINAMIKKSSDNSTRSQDVATQSSDIAKRGKDAVDRMSQAINEINVSNEAISKQINESNGQISDIARVIAEIGNKTKVINDIVFQTKLLSFNASVEAARAGEHGKGFAVVAEEVGNLAQMSGNAAKEISDMLAESIKRVETIVDETKQKVERLIADGRQKVQSGILIANQCGAVLTEVVTNVDELNTMVTEISVAGQEQSQGVNEITKAMNELDQTTHSNATTSQKVSGYASSLSDESVHLKDLVGELMQVISGGSPGEPSKAKEPLTQSKEKTGKVVELSTATNKRVAVKQLKKASGDQMPEANDPRFKDV